MFVLEAFDLYRFYHTGEDETLALRGVSLKVAAGEMVAVMGPSGSGKSTMFACLAGLDEPDGGYVRLLGHRITHRPETERAAIRTMQIGIMLQSGNLFNHLSVADNIRLTMLLARKMNEERLNYLLAITDLSKRRNALPGQISGGETARAGLCVALANEPRILLADEPTGEVDAGTERRILDLFETYRRGGGAVMYATHSQNLAGRADRLIGLRDGRVTDD
jgi:putative ABC transport system ATP-binding protein